jgi:hypothetical protein
MKESATMSAQPETTATETPKVKTQVSATLSPEAFQRLDDYRWSNRINKTSEVVAQAIDFFLDAKAKEVKAK